MCKSSARAYRTNFDGLLAELQREYADKQSDNASQMSNQPSKVVPFPDGFPDSDATWKQVRSDDKIKYALHFGKVHDKCCPQIQDVPAHLLEFVEKYPSEYTQCDNCAIRAYILNGAEDTENIDKYVAFFQRVKWKRKNLREFFIEHDVRTRIDTDVITVWYKDDTWRIKINPGTPWVDLMHNNYTVQGKNRYFTNGFHLQKSCVTMNEATFFLLNYNFHSHFDPVQPAKKRVEVTTKTKTTESPATTQKEEQPVQKSPSKEPTNETLTVIGRIKMRIRSYLMKLLGFEKRINIDGLICTKLAGKPAPGEICIIQWKAKDEEEHWIIAMYSEKKQRFYATFGGYQVRIPEEKVLAWKSIDLASISETPTDGTVGIQIIS